MTSQRVAFLKAKASWQMCRLVRQPGFTDAFYKSDGKGSWRAPFVNESCCIRTNLADLLDAIGAQVRPLDMSISALGIGCLGVL